MKLVTAQNVNDAYVSGMTLLDRFGERRTSRNGMVLTVPEPVTTHYAEPRERVLFNRQRNANPFFHLFEALWMLTGARDVAFPSYFVPRMADFSDDGETFNAAYGFRWRHYGLRFNEAPNRLNGLDQLEEIVDLLTLNPDDRRVMLQMWDPYWDLGSSTKDAACNTCAKFAIRDGRLNMTVFNRSNDIIMGCYGANAVQFSVLQEYLAARIGVEVGWYEQISTDFHAYQSDWDKFWPIDIDVLNDPDWYDSGTEAGVVIEPLVVHPLKFDAECKAVVCAVRERDHTIRTDVTRDMYNPFFHRVCQPMAEAYAQYRGGLLIDAVDTIDVAIAATRSIDWLIAGRRWLTRRKMHSQLAVSAENML